MIPVQVDHKDFWHIRFKPEVVEWQFLIRKLLNSVKTEAWNDWIRTTHEESGDYVFLVSKKRYPVELLSKTFGISVDKIKSLEMIVLDPPTAREDLPKPTVPDWGEA